MRKTLLLLVVLLFSVASYVNATPVNFVTDMGGSSVVLSGNTAVSSQSFGTQHSAILTADLATTLSDELFTLSDGESSSFDFFNFDLDIEGYPIAGGNFTVEATLAFSPPNDANVTGGGSGTWGTFLGAVSGGILTWSNIPTTFTLLDGNEITIAFASGVDIFCGTDTMIQATVTNNGGAPVPEPATILLLGGGLAGLAFYRRKKK